MREHTQYNPTDDSSFNLDQLRLYEDWCAFLHNEHTKNKLCILEAIARNVYGPNDTIPHRYLKNVEPRANLQLNCIVFIFVLMIRKTRLLGKVLVAAPSSCRLENYIL